MRENWGIFFEWDIVKLEYLIGFKGPDPGLEMIKKNQAKGA
jgi:hypothetical protein